MEQSSEHRQTHWESATVKVPTNAPSESPSTVGLGTDHGVGTDKSAYVVYRLLVFISGRARGQWLRAAAAAHYVRHEDAQETQHAKRAARALADELRKCLYVCTIIVEPNIVFGTDSPCGRVPGLRERSRICLETQIRTVAICCSETVYWIVTIWRQLRVLDHLVATAVSFMEMAGTGERLTVTHSKRRRLASVSSGLVRRANILSASRGSLRYTCMNEALSRTSRKLDTLRRRPRF